MAVDQTTEISSVSWDWQPGGRITARGKVTVSHGGSEQPPMTLHFEIPVTQLPARSVLADPQSWLLSRLRQALRPSRLSGTAPARADRPQ